MLLDNERGRAFAFERKRQMTLAERHPSTVKVRPHLELNHCEDFGDRRNDPRRNESDMTKRKRACLDTHQRKVSEISKIYLITAMSLNWKVNYRESHFQLYNVKKNKKIAAFSPRS